MSMTEEVEALRNVPMFASLDDSKLKLLSFTSEWVEYQPGDSLCREGEKGEEAFVITVSYTHLTLPTNREV